MKTVAVAAWCVAVLVAPPVLLAQHALAAQWIMDKAHSRLSFSGTQVGSTFTGKFSRFDATIDFDPAKPAAGHVVVTVDLTSAGTDDTQRDEALPQSDWFDTAKFPQARFEASGFLAKGGNAFEAPGTLTLRGVSKQLTLPFTLTASGDSAHAVGHVQIVRTDFGVGQGEWKSGDTVGLQVGVDFDVTATRAH
jgi:polyisoprenoid-binding protein YceI